MNRLWTWGAVLSSHTGRLTAATAVLAAMVWMAHPATSQDRNFRQPSNGSRFDRRGDRNRYSTNRVDAVSYERGDDPRTRARVDDITRSLIEDQLRDDHRYNTRPRVDVNPRVINSPTREMIAARRVLSSVTRSADSLATYLNQDMRRVSGVRPYFDDLLRLRARVSLLNQRAQQLNDHELIREDLKALDRDWRLLSYRLAQIRGLSNNTIAEIREINNAAKTLGRDFEIDPQLDRQELLVQISALSHNLHNLLEDIEVELPRSQQKTQFLLAGRRIEQQAIQVAHVLRGHSGYREVISEYNEFQRLWYPFASQLRPLNNRYLERSVSRISLVDNDMHDLLWMPHRLDRERLLHLTSVLKRDVDDFFVRAPLKLLVDLPQSDQVLSVADQFYGVCEHFTDVVQRNEDKNELVDAYHYIEDGWRSFASVFRPLRSQAAQQVLSEIEHDITNLGQALQIQGGGSSTGYDYVTLVQTAAALDNHAQHLETDIGAWLSRSRESFRAQALRDTAQFSATCRRVHEMLTIRATRQELEREVHNLTRDWANTYEWIARCNTNDKPHLLRLAAQISPAVVEIRTQVTPY